MSEIVEQLSLWGEIYPYFRFNKKPIILLEMFAGIGAQRKALEILGVQIDDHQSKICEWAYNSYCGYNAIHIKDKTDYSNGKTKEEMLERIKGTSMNYNDPLTLQQLNKKPIEWLKKAYNNCVATNNLINIMEVKGSDLGELPKEQTSILTYSFPCQDLSLAGKRKGMSESQANGGTRSGLLWEIERILIERERENSTLPTILLMENVPEVVGKVNITYFKKWEERLRQFGYSNYVETLNGKNYGIPQNRRRCFMISILGEYAYDFPCKIPLKYRLKDLLEKEVDEKYYLTEKQLKDVQNWNAYEKPLENMEKTDQKNISPTLTTRSGAYAAGMILIKNATRTGYLEAKDGDGIDIGGRMKSHRGTVQKGLAQTLKTDCDVGVVVKNDSMITETEARLFTEDGNIRRYIGSEKVDEFKEGQMATTTFPNGYGHGPRTHNESIALNTIDRPVVKQNLRIRKLTPKECMRLMGFSDEDYQALKDTGLSDSAIYHVAGDSIITTCLVAIFNSFVNNKSDHISIIEKYVEQNIIEKRR